MASSILTPPIPALLVRWQQQCDAIADAAVELTVEEFSAMRETYWALRRAGYRFNYATAALMTALERQLADEDLEDGDADVDDAPEGRF